MYVIVIGGGRVGRVLLTLLSAEGYEVSVVEKSMARCSDLASGSDALIIQGDGTDVACLEDAGAKKADVLMAVTRDDNVNVMACQLAKTFNVPKVIARVNDPKNKEIYAGLGLDATVSTTENAALALKNAVSGVRSHSVLTHGTRELVEIAIPKGSPATDQLLGTLRLPNGCKVLGVYRGQDILLPDRDIIVLPGDSLLIVTEMTHIRKLRTALIGK